MQKPWSMFLRIFLCFLLLFAIFYNTAFAAPGEGDGGGGGPAVPLMMDWSYPANGENNVSVIPIIQCKYSHNIALGKVLKRNVKMFTLAKLDGTKVPINVFAADAQLEFDKRQYIYLEPVRPLEYNTTYVVTAEEGIQAKNGMVTEKNQSFQFTTGRLRTDFNETNVSSMIKEENRLTENTKSKEISAPKNTVLTKKSYDSSVKEKPKKRNAKDKNNKRVNEKVSKEVSKKAMKEAKNSDSPITVCIAGISLLLLSIVVSIIRIKLQK